MRKNPTRTRSTRRSLLVTFIVAALIGAFMVAAPLGALADEPNAFTEVDGATNGGGEAAARAARAAEVRSGHTFFFDRTTFDLATGPLTLEDFEGPLVTPGFSVCPGPIDSATGGGGCYPVGELEPGFAFDAFGGGGNTLVAISPPAGFGFTSTVVGPDSFADSAVFTFSGTVTAVGFDIFDPFGATSVDVEVFGASGSLGVTTVATGFPPTGSFVGVTSPSEPIVAVTISDLTPGAAAQIFDDLEFGLADIPTCRGVDATIIGTASDDVILGTPGDDVIVAGRGNDIVNAGGGNDLICGEKGHDTLFGEDGRDEIYGDLGHDTIDGGAGSDMLFGNKGDDELVGRGGNDRLNGAQGRDSLDGGHGDDTLLGGLGADDLDAGAGDDLVWGGAGADNLLGGIGDDDLRGEAGNDTLDGDKGSNELRGGRGVDTCLNGDLYISCEL